MLTVALVATGCSGDRSGPAATSGDASRQRRADSRDATVAPTDDAAADAVDEADLQADGARYAATEQSEALVASNSAATPAAGAVPAGAAPAPVVAHNGLPLADSDAEGELLPPPADAAPEQFNTESYDEVVDNRFLHVSVNRLSTFSIDVDTASYSNVRRFLTSGAVPPKGAVRIEELLNYFAYRYAPPTDETPFAVHTEIATCPWQPAHRLVRIGLKGREIELDNRPSSNLVFLLDVSGSMDEPNKLPLLQQAMRLLVEQLSENDRVSIVVYAGAAGLVLPSTTGDRKEEILSALDALHAGGPTNGGQGIQLAYDTAAAHFLNGGTNRVILCTDGDFNVGTTDESSLVELIQERAQQGVFLSVLGFGQGNYQDDHMESLADRGNGNYAYIDTLQEARKVLVEQMSGTLITIAKDVKIQIEFNPATVAGYRLIGYENRLLRAEDFNDDRKDAGEIGAGHTVTALYEVVPVGQDVPGPDVDELEFGTPAEPADELASDAILKLKLRYKQPDGAESKLIEHLVRDEGLQYGQASTDFRFAAAVAAFGMLLRESEHKGSATWGGVLELAQEGLADDAEGYRAEFVNLVQAAQALRP
jgi:Ca-activated chloride channel family protein